MIRGQGGTTSPCRHLYFGRREGPVNGSTEETGGSPVTMGPDSSTRVEGPGSCPGPSRLYFIHGLFPHNLFTYLRVYTNT